jgi:hypothetical protein
MALKLFHHAKNADYAMLSAVFACFESHKQNVIASFAATQDFVLVFLC